MAYDPNEKIKKLIRSDTTIAQDMGSNGLYTRSVLEQNYFRHFHRFGYFDPYHELTNTREYLFFLKPDLHIVERDGSLNPELSNEPFFMELFERYYYLIPYLQLSCPNFNNDFTSANPFIPLLTNTVRNNMDMPDISSTNIDNATNIYGTSYEYRGSGESSDDNHSFSLEFKDTKFLEVYMYFKAIEEYSRLKKHGRVTPPNQNYIVKKILHDQTGIYKFLVSDDMQNIVYYSYACGVTANTVPRSAFSNNNFTDGVIIPIDFKAAFIDDMNPIILRDFNELVSPLVKELGDTVPISGHHKDDYDRLNSSWVEIPYIEKVSIPNSYDYHGTSKYLLKWAGEYEVTGGINL